MSGIGMHDGIVIGIAQHPKNDPSPSIGLRSNEILSPQSRARALRIRLICFSNLALLPQSSFAGPGNRRAAGFQILQKHYLIGAGA